MPQVSMLVTKTELSGPDQGKITAEAVNGPIQGTLILTCRKAIVKALDPGDTITVTFARS